MEALQIFVFDQITVGAKQKKKKHRMVFDIPFIEFFISLKIVFRILSRPPTFTINFNIPASFI